jgi:hypothetical protein
MAAMAMNGERAALEAAWRFFLHDPHETSFAQVVAFARDRCPSVSREMVRAEFERRFRRNPAAVASPLEDVAHLRRSPLTAARCPYTARI